MIKTSRLLELEASETGTKKEKNLQILLNFGKKTCYLKPN